MSLFKVPEHIASVIFGGGCGAAHSGDADCELCAPLAADHVYPAPPAPEFASGGAVDLSASPPVIDAESGPENIQPAKGRTKTQPAE